MLKTCKRNLYIGLLWYQAILIWAMTLQKFNNTQIILICILILLIPCQAIMRTHQNVSAGNKDIDSSLFTFNCIPHKFCFAGEYFYGKGDNNNTSVNDKYDFKKQSFLETQQSEKYCSVPKNTFLGDEFDSTLSWYINLF